MTKLIKQIVGYTSALAIILGISLVVLYLPSQDVNFGVDKTSNHLKLKASKEKILSHKVLKEYKLVKKENNLLGATATSTAISTATSTNIIPEYDYVEVVENPSSVVEYIYVSDIISTSSVYFDKNETLSNSEYLSPREDNIKPLVFYSEDKWAKDNGQIVNILTATTTLEEFDKIYKISRVDNFRNFFINTSIATSTYTSSGTYTPPCAGNVQVLVVAGGGGGGMDIGGAGGAGGYQYNSALTVTAQAYSITVGGGGGKATTTSMNGYSGGNSVFSTITSLGGGGGSSRSGPAAPTGGSGGGGSYNAKAAGLGTAGQGYNGGACSIGVAGTGGGGGAGAVGANNSGNNGGNGGNGTANSISGSSVYYAGGGGGCNYGGGVNGGGGNGGGGNGGNSNTPIDGQPGTANTGGGGGGGYSAATGTGGAGGSGIIIIVEPECVVGTIISPKINFE